MEERPRFRGAMTAIVTPFLDDGALDCGALERIVGWQVEQGIQGVVPCGTTGEGATLEPDEQTRVIETVVRAVDGRVPVVAGCGSNDTRRTVLAARGAAEAGADALLVVTPYYNKPNRSGMIAHYETVASATNLPVVVYNVPGRTGQNLGVELILRLAKVPGIVAVKEASGDLEQIGAILERRPPEFAVLSGDDALNPTTTPNTMIVLVSAGATRTVGRAEKPEPSRDTGSPTPIAVPYPAATEHSICLISPNKDLYGTKP